MRRLNSRLVIKSPVSTFRFQILGGMTMLLCFASFALAQGRVGGLGGMPNPANTGAPATDLSATVNSRLTNSENRKRTGSLSATDKDFLVKAASGGVMEVEGGKIAAQKARNADVKKFGNRMVNDHSRANDELRSLAARKGFGLPNGRSSMNWKSDKAFMDTMVKDHEEDLTEFQNEAQNGSDIDVKTFADRNSKVIAKHLAIAKEIDGKLK